MAPKRPSPPLDGHAELRVGESLIRYRITRSPRRKKTIQITLDPVRGVRVAAPLKASDARIEEVVRGRAAWIAKTTAVMEKARPKPRRFQTGEVFSYLGREVLLRVFLWMDRGSRVALREGKLDVTIPQAVADPSAAVEQVLDLWYRGEALKRLAPAVDSWGAVMGLKAKRVLVRDQKTLWGSCAVDGTIRFNWRTVQVQPALMDYIVVHELVHLKHRSHSPRFWNELARYMPDYLERRKRLRKAGLSLGL